MSIGRALVLIFCLGLVACDDNREEVVAQLIESRVQEKLEDFKEAERKRCMEQIWKDANAAADSLLRLDPILVKLDSLQRPPKPLKPSMPAFEKRTDSIEIAPLIPKIKNDTTLRLVKDQ